MSNELRLLKDILAKYGYSITKTRKHVLTALAISGPTTMHDLISSLPDTDRSSVYRSVALFERLGVVNRIQLGWKYKLELSDSFSHHHHHLICKKCSDITEFNIDPKIEELLNTSIQFENFVPVSHQIEITGVCKKCN